MAHIVLTNNDLLKEITKWHILKYINFPDIFLNIICNDNNIYYLSWLLTDKYLTFEMLNIMVQNVLPDISALQDLPGVNITSFTEYVLWVTKSFKLFLHIITNYEDERKIILNSKIFEQDTTLRVLNGNLKSLRQKLDLVKIYQEVGMLPKQLPIVHEYMGPHKMGSGFGNVCYETSLWYENDILTDVLWKNKNKGDTYKNEMIIAPGLEGYNSKKYRSVKEICDKPDRNCNHIIYNFGDFIKIIKT
jgi:hypothetical protein